MDMRKFRSPESHVAQQSRRDKLRVQQSSNLLHHLEDFPNIMEQESSPLHPGLNPDLVQVRNVRNANLLYDPSLIPSGIIHFPTNPNVSTIPAEESSSFPAGMSHPRLSKLNANSSKLSGDPQGYNSQQSCDWMVSYNASGSLGVSRESNIQNPMFVAQVLSNNGGESAATQYLKPNYSSYQDVQSSDLSNPGSEISSQDSRRQLYGDLNFVSPYGTVTTASVGNQGQENIARASNSWIDYSGNQPWMNRPVMEHCQQWGGELGFLAIKSSQEVHRDNATTQGLSLSLSSSPKPKICDAAQLTDDQYGLESKPFPKPSIISKTSGKSVPETGGTSSASLHRHTGPLGPFTGYATILKNSRFLKPAQELLDEFCHSTNSKVVKVCDANEGITSGEASGSASVDAANTVDMEGGGSKGNNNSVASSSTFYSCNEIGVDHGGVGSSSDEPCRPEYQQKKAKLLYLQEEVGY
ncbi:POX family protein [Corchorus olitorius]|uniref:POX family protein n=1 Tax=Corchorus olitorius TaxID=93759 RepID=A0A1R3J9S3_9ROSI|nr:POX family protein [Corchorus olitorius]